MRKYSGSWSVLSIQQNIPYIHTNIYINPYTMGKFGYSDGIALLQIIVFPVILVAAILLWRRVGWREGGKSWRFVVTLSLLRIAGSICTFLRINNASNKRIFIAEAVCELIGIAPLLLTYIGLLGQM
jgi:hypothetical protein